MILTDRNFSRATSLDNGGLLRIGDGDTYIDEMFMFSQKKKKILGLYLDVQVSKTYHHRTPS